MKHNARMLRSNMTDTEQCLWRHLRKRQLGDALFRRQFEIGAYIVDFVCLSARVIVECDGGQHQEQQEYDQIRDTYLRSQGFTVLRFWNHEVLQQTSAVLEKIFSYLPLHPNPPPQGRRGLEEPCQNPILQGRGGLGKPASSDLLSSPSQGERRLGNPAFSNPLLPCGGGLGWRGPEESKPHSHEIQISGHLIKLSPHASALEVSGAAATIGAFDGIHLGHQHLISQLTKKAKDHGLLSLVILFEPHPKEFFALKRKSQPLARMTYLRDKAVIFKSLGVDALYVLRFNEALLKCPAQRFIQILSARLHLKCVVIGDDFRFGQDRGGDFALLKTLGQDLGFSVFASQTYEMLGARVSSSRVREALLVADFTLAHQLQGRAFTLQGHVVYGDQLGSELGFPTLNFVLKSPFVLHGIYAVRVKIPGRSQLLIGAASIGTRPAVQGQDLRLEVHLLDFSGNLYGQIVQVTFFKKIRDEQNFPSLQALTDQIQRDCEEVRVILDNPSSNAALS